MNGKRSIAKGVRWASRYEYLDDQPGMNRDPEGDWVEYETYRELLDAAKAVLSWYAGPLKEIQRLVAEGNKG